MKKLISLLLVLSVLAFCFTSCTSSRVCQKCDGTGWVFCCNCNGYGKLGTRCSLCEGDGKCAYCDRGKTECKKGNGHIDKYNCPICHNSGVKTCTFCNGDDECWECHGSGYSEGPTSCYYCDGMGETRCTECEN